MQAVKRAYRRTGIFLKYVLDISPTEIRGIRGLIFLFLIVDAILLIYPFIPYSRQRAAVLKSYVIELEAEANAPPEPMMAFMPDTVTADQLIRWGWPPTLAGNLVSYREKAGSFRDEAQIRRLYGMNDSIFQILKPHLRFRATKTAGAKKDTVRRREFRRCPEPMDINMADSLMLLRLHGIGPVLAGRIMGYRNILGGYVRVDQLTEVYGLSEDTFNHILHQLYIDPEYQPEKIDLNAGNYSDLYRHPYLSSRQAVALIRYRQQHGSIRSMEELRKNPLFSGEDIERLRPYLAIQDTIPFRR